VLIAQVSSHRMDLPTEPTLKTALLETFRSIGRITLTASTSQQGRRLRVGDTGVATPQDDDLSRFFSCFDDVYRLSGLPNKSGMFFIRKTTENGRWLLVFRLDILRHLKCRVSSVFLQSDTTTDTDLLA
jgi:hypothetical protein